MNNSKNPPTKSHLFTLSFMIFMLFSLLGKQTFGAAPTAPPPPDRSATTGDGLIAIPPYAKVTDLSGTLTAPDQEGLRDEITTLKEQKGAQIAVLMVPTTTPETIEQFGIRLFDAWKLGRKGVDDGVLIIVAKDDRKMRIEVGYGLEPVLTDLVAGRIIDELMRPKFRANDYRGGLSAAVQQVAKVIGGEPLPPVAKPTPPTVDIYLPPLWVFLAVVILIVAAGFLGKRLPAHSSYWLAGLVSGGLFWLNTSPGFAVFLTVVTAGMLFLVANVLNPRDQGQTSSNSPYSSSDSYSDSSSSSWSDSSSSSSSSDDSGGGGSSGGGGASGDW